VISVDNRMFIPYAMECGSVTGYMKRSLPVGEVRNWTALC